MHVVFPHWFGVLDFFKYLEVTRLLRCIRIEMESARVIFLKCAVLQVVAKITAKDRSQTR